MLLLNLLPNLFTIKYICNIIYIFGRVNLSPSLRSKKNTEKHHAPIKISDLYNTLSNFPLIMYWQFEWINQVVTIVLSKITCSID